MRPMPFVRLFLLAAAAMTVLPPYVPAQSAPAEEPPCDDPEDFTPQPGSGPACYADGVWLVRLPDGEILTTHGPDPPWEPFPRVPDPAAPVCVPDGEPHNEVIYARPMNLPDKYAATAPTLRTLVAQANGQLKIEAGPFVARNYKFLCNANFEIVVHNAPLNLNSANDDFASIVDKLNDSPAFAKTNVHYWVFYDDSVNCACAGQGNWRSDSQLSTANANNGGPRYGISYGVLSYDVLMHENGHNMGAVQNDSPNTSGEAHCTDEIDIMCQPPVGTPIVCADRVWFDCNHNDYFNVNLNPGGYLQTHWNLGHPVNLYIQAGGPLVAQLSCDPNPSVKGQQVHCQSHATLFTGNPTYRFDWGDGSPPTFVSPGIQIAHAFHTWNLGGRYKVTVTVTDGSGLTSPPASLTQIVTCGLFRSQSLLVGVPTATFVHELVPGSWANENNIPTDCVGFGYTLTGSHPADTYGIWWLNENFASLGFHQPDLTTGVTSGMIPAGTRHAKIYYWTGAGGAYTLTSP